jgi:hypothetical protein
MRILLGLLGFGVVVTVLIGFLAVLWFFVGMPILAVVVAIFS